MTESPRPQSWFASWMVGEDAVAARRQQVDHLVSSVKSGHYDKDTLLDLISILKHEILCTYVSKTDTTQNQAVSPPFPRALSNHWADSLLLDASGPIIQSLNEETYAYRMLQCQLLLAIMSLLHAQGVHTLRADCYEKLHRNLEARFKDLQWQPGGSGELTIAKFHKVQCSFLLSATAEYAARFKKAEPLAITVAGSVIHLLTAGLASAGPAMGGSVDLAKILSELDRALKSVSYHSNQRYRGLFTLQEFASIASALNLYSVMVKGDPTRSEHSRQAGEIAQRCTELGLAQLMALLREEGSFETKVTPPSSFWANFRAVVNHGPPSFDLFYYIFGLLDCNIVFCAENPANMGFSILDLDYRIKQIVLQGTEPAFRWKALQYLCLRYPTADNLVQQLLAGGNARNMPYLKKEILDIHHDVWNKRDTIIEPIFRSPSSTSPSESSREPLVASIERAGCLEPAFSVPEITDGVKAFDLGATTLRRKQFEACGLSPDCRAAYLMQSDRVVVLSLNDLGAKRERKVCTIEAERNSEYERAALSDTYLAVCSKEALYVTGYSATKIQVQITAMERFPVRADGLQWSPRCLAIRDVQHRSWIAVAGETFDDGITWGSILMYEVRRTRAGLELVKCNVSFGTAGLDNPLKEARIKFIHFDPDGGRLVCITTANKVLVWYLSNNMRPLYAPFSLTREYQPEPNVQGFTSAHVFHSPSKKAYILCTAWASGERALFKGEWCFLSPVGKSTATVSPDVVHNLVQFRKDAAIIASAASPTGDVVAVTDKTGRVFVLPLKSSTWGGLRTNGVVELDKHLISQEKTSSSALRFVWREGALHLFAIDRKGKVLHKTFEGFARPAEKNLELEVSNLGMTTTDDGSSSDASLRIMQREMSRRGTLDASSLFDMV